MLTRNLVFCLFNQVIPIMDYFDESIFFSGIILKDNDKVAVTNRADAFLVTKYGKTPTAVCNVNAKITLNPQITCFGLNVYTMDVTCKQVLDTYNFHKIIIVDPVETSERIKIQDLNKNKTTQSIIYEYNEEITSFESAIMLKYYAKTQPIYISMSLYLYVNEHFKDGKLWFEFTSDFGNILNKKQEIYTNNEFLLNYNILHLSDKAVNFQ